MIIFDTAIFLSLGVSNLTSLPGEALILGLQAGGCRGTLFYAGSRWLCRKEQFLAALGLCRSWEGLPAAQGAGEEASGRAKRPARLQRAPFHSSLFGFLFLVWFFFFSL